MFDYSQKENIMIGICGGDGIGPIITHEAQRMLEFLLAEEVAQGKISFKVIDGLTIENRIEHMKAIPDDVLAELKSCDVILKGPTTTPQKGDGRPNIESANVAMRKELDYSPMFVLSKCLKKALTGSFSVKTPRAAMPLLSRYKYQ